MLAWLRRPSAGNSSSEEQPEEQPGQPRASNEARPAGPEAGVGRHGCSHYRRRCKLVAPCCGEVFWCRHCHNTVKDKEEQDEDKRHEMVRADVKEVVCALCDTRQPVSRACTACGCAFGQYTCLQCNFFEDNTSKGQFHCEHCKICRVGGRENFFHCHKCGSCYAKKLQGKHKCVEGSMQHDCAVCLEYLFNSTSPISVLRCGHTIHTHCLEVYVKNYHVNCPVCNFSFTTD